MNGSTEVEYVSQKIFDLQLKNLNDRADYEKDLTEERLDKFQAVMEKNFAEMKSVIVEMRGEIKVLDKKIDGTNERIDGLEKRFNDMKEHQNKWFTVFGILFSVAAIVAPIAVAIIQRVWK